MRLSGRNRRSIRISAVFAALTSAVTPLPLGIPSAVAAAVIRVDLDATGADNGCVATGNDCDTAGMALHDVFLWKQQAGTSLPGSAATGGGDVTIAFDDTVTPPLYTITVSWEEPGITALDAAPNYVVTIPVNPF